MFQLQMMLKKANKQIQVLEVEIIEVEKKLERLLDEFEEWVNEQVSIILKHNAQNAMSTFKESFSVSVLGLKRRIEK